MGKEEEELKRLREKARTFHYYAGEMRLYSSWPEGQIDRWEGRWHPAITNKELLKLLNAITTEFPKVERAEEAVEQLIVKLRGELARIIAEETQAKAIEEEIASVIINIQGFKQRLSQTPRKGRDFEYPLLSHKEAMQLEELTGRLQNLLEKEIELDKAKEKAEQVARKLIKELLKDE